MDITDDMLWPLRILMWEKPHLFTEETHREFTKYFVENLDYIKGRCGKNYMIETALSQSIKLQDEEIPMLNKTNQITLLLDFYEVDNSARKHEIVSSIQNNINNKFIDNVVIFTEVSVDKISKLMSCFKLNSKVSIIPNCNRITFRSALEYADETKNDDSVFVLLNNDCYFDETINLLRKIDFKNGNRVLSMTRKDLNNGVVENATNPFTDSTERGNLIGPESSDAWAFKRTLNNTKAKLDIELGRNHCDQQFFGRIYEDGYEVRNVGFCNHIKCIHNHNSKYRDMNRWNTNLESEYNNKNYMMDFWEDDFSASRNYDNYVVNSWMNFHKNNYFIDDRLSGEYGKFVVRDIKELF